jgi:hypothetical protein
LKSGQVGRHLHIQPTARIAALFDEPIEGWHGVPQSLYIDHHAPEGIVLEGMFVPPGIAALGLPGFGESHKRVMSCYRNLASFGVRISDSSAGRVTRGLGGEPIMSYQLNQEDVEKLVKGIAITAEIFFAAGAKSVFTPIHRFTELESGGDVTRLCQAKVRPSDLMGLAAFHPLGTCRMGCDPNHSVVDSQGESYEVKNLFICDASIFPTLVGVNPQITIMAFASKMADFINRVITGRT